MRVRIVAISRPCGESTARAFRWCNSSSAVVKRCGFHLFYNCGGLSWRAFASALFCFASRWYFLERKGAIKKVRLMCRVPSATRSRASQEAGESLPAAGAECSF